MDHFVQSVGTGSGTSPFGTAVQPGAGDGLLRRQHRHGAVELRAALRDERQLLRHDLRAVGPGRDQPRLGRHRRSRHHARGEQPVGLHLDLARRRPHAERPRRLLADQRRPALLGRLLDARRRRDDGHEHRRRAERKGPHLGLVRGRLPAERELRRSAGGGRQERASRRARSSPTSSAPFYANAEHRPAHSSQPEPTATRCTRSASPRRHGPVGLQGRLHPPPRAVPVLRLDRQPAPPDDPDQRRAGRTRSRASSRSATTRSPTSTACRSSTRRTTTTT